MNPYAEGKLFFLKRWREPATSNLGLRPSSQASLVLPHLQQSLEPNKSPVSIRGDGLLVVTESCCLCTPKSDATFSLSRLCYQQPCVFIPQHRASWSLAIPSSVGNGLSPKL